MSPRPLPWRRLWWSVWFSGLAGLLTLSLLPLPGPPPAVPHWDKLLHTLAYALLMGWAVPLFTAARGWTLAALGLLGWGVMIEGLQGLLPWRSIEMADVLANALGVLLGSLLGFTPWRRIVQTLERPARRPS